MHQNGYVTITKSVYVLSSAMWLRSRVCIKWFLYISTETNSVANASYISNSQSCYKLYLHDRINIESRTTLIWPHPLHKKLSTRLHIALMVCYISLQPTCDQMYLYLRAYAGDLFLPYICWDILVCIT